MYSFDPVGSYQREEYRAGGSAGALLQPLLDNQVELHHLSTLFVMQKGAKSVRSDFTTLSFIVCLL